MCFEKKDYDAKISVYDISNRILSCDTNYIADVVMWPQFGNSSTSMKEVIMT